MSILFRNFNIIRDGKVTPSADLLVREGKISAIGAGLDATADRVIDGEGRLCLSAGFIDIHTHGAAGCDFMDADADEYNKIARCFAAHGATELYPTTIAASKEELTAVLGAFSAAKNGNDGARLLGLHLEGPYISAEQNGALDLKYIRDAKPEEYSELFALSDDIKRMTVAPEVDGVAELGRYMSEHGVVGSIGHSNAYYEDVVRAHDEGGYRLMTHFYSCMSSMRRHNGWRRAGVIEAGYLMDDVMVEVICDGCHLPEEYLRLIYKVKGASNIILVTDSMRAAGTEDTVSILGSRKNGTEVLVEDGVAKLTDRSAFAGSVATPDRLVRVMTSHTPASLAEAVMMMTENPARAMHIDDKYGRLEVGRAADITVFDDDVDIKLTLVGGNVVFEK